MGKLTGNEPAMPLSDGDHYERGAGSGLTIRQQFAAMAMQGLLAHHGNPDGWDEREDLMERIKYLVLSSVAHADALINELNKDK